MFDADGVIFRSLLVLYITLCLTVLHLLLLLFTRSYLALGDQLLQMDFYKESQ